MVYIMALFNSIYRFVEKWHHRIQGHALVTINGGEAEFWVVDIYSEYGEWWADVPGSEAVYLLDPLDDVVITGG